VTHYRKEEGPVEKKRREEKEEEKEKGKSK
jgi:hypothetical protein